MAASKPKARPDLAAYEIGDELVVYDPETGGVHHLDATVALVLGLCDGTATVKETAVDVADVSNVSPAEAEPTVRTIVRELRNRGLLERKKPPSTSDGGADATDQRQRIRMDVPRSS